jgi:hypothetical protein
MRMTVRNRITGLALIAVVGALFIGPASALAQDSLANPSAAQYEPQSQVQGTTTTGAVASNSSGGSSNGSSTGTLPFTGMDVIVLSAVALALIGTGVALRRLSAPKAPRI